MIFHFLWKVIVLLFIDSVDLLFRIMNSVFSSAFTFLFWILFSLRVIIVIYVMTIASINICAWNVRGAMTSIAQLCKVMESNDIIFISEHWLTCEHISLLATLDTEFKSFAKEAESSKYGRNKGGIAFLVRNSLHVKHINVSSDRLSIIQIQLGERLLSVIGCHLPSTNESLGQFDECMSELFDIYDELEPGSDVLICGDLNSNPNKCISTVDTATWDRNYLVANGMLNRHLVSVFDITLRLSHAGPRHSYRSKDNSRKSLIDHFIVPDSVLPFVAETGIDGSLSYDISDHYPVTLKLHADCHSSKLPVGVAHVNWKRRDRGDIQLYKHNVTEKLGPVWECLTPSNEDVENLSEFIVSSLHQASVSLPVVKQRHSASHCKPYWKSAGLREPHNEMKIARNQWLAAGRPRDGQTYVTYKAKKKAFRQAHRRAKKSQNVNLLRDIERSAELDINEFYKTVRKQRQNRVECPMRRVDGSLATSDDEIREVWCEHFKALSTPILDSVESAHTASILKDLKMFEKQSHQNIETILDREISKKEIDKVVRTLPKSKAPGKDGITNEHVLYASDSLVNHLHMLFSWIIKCEYSPVSFRTGTIIPLYKGKNKEKSDPNNYRGITLTSVLGKILEKVILERIWEYCDGIRFPHDLQMGFRKGFGCNAAVFLLRECISHFIERSSVCYCAFLDNQKAFDTVWHQGLFHKVYSLGINAKLWRLICQCYGNMQSCVLYRGQSSSVFPVRQGVGQGRVLSAWLFLVYINDLIVELSKSNLGLRVGSMNIPCVLLCDDTTVPTSTPQDMIRQLQVVEKYANVWKLTYNAPKSAMVIFRCTRNKKPVNNVSFEIGGSPIPVKESVVYAGVNFNASLTPKDTVLNLCKKARQNIHSLSSVGVRSGGLDPIASTKIWLRMILPCALYGCEFLTNLSKSDYLSFERLQRHFARYIQGFYVRTSSTAVVASLGLWSIRGYIDKLKLLLFGRLCNLPSNCTLKSVFLFRLCRGVVGPCRNPCGLIYEFTNALRRYSLLDTLTNFVQTMYFPEPHIWRKTVVDAIDSFEFRQYRESVDNNSAIIRFGEIKILHGFHPCWFLGRKFKTLSLQFRFLVLLSMVKSGIERDCNLCKKKVVDIVNHIILHCESFIAARDELFDNLLDVMDFTLFYNFYEQEEDIVLEGLLGGTNNVLYSLTACEWEHFMVTSAQGLYKFRPGFPVPLF